MGTVIQTATFLVSKDKIPLGWIKMSFVRAYKWRGQVLRSSQKQLQCGSGSERSLARL